MKATGIVRNIDNVGRVVIPKGIMKSLALSNGDPLEFYVDGNRIILQPYVASEDKARVDELLAENAELKKQLECLHARRL